jgi:hypothetical protein
MIAFIIEEHPNGNPIHGGILVVPYFTVDDVVGVPEIDVSGNIMVES